MDRPKLRTRDARVSALGIAKHTLTAIENGEYPPGAALREQALADRFGCSRAPVREALRILESQGLVVIEPMRGAHVAELRESAFYEVFHIRRALAGVVVRLACENGSPEGRAHLRATADHALLLAREDADPDAYHDAVRAIIRLLPGLADADRTVQIIRGLTFGREAFQAATFASPERRLETAMDWVALAEAIEGAEVATAIEVMFRIYDRAFTFMDGQIPDPDGTGPSARKPSRAAATSRGRSGKRA